VGLNLTKATHVLFCEPWWNPYVELQAEDRAYRMGQEKPVTIHRFTTLDSIEEKLNALKAQKMKLGDAVFSREDADYLLRGE
jgi:SNF2 family DNA or RNA helicase